MEEIMLQWGREVLSVALLLPLLWFLLRSFVKTNKEGFESIVDGLKEHDKTSKELFKLILSSTGKVKLDDEKTIEIAKKYVLAASFEKLSFIKARLEKNNLKERRLLIERQIRSELVRISKNEYITPLNHFTTPLWPLGDWINNNFHFEDFIVEVYDVVFRNENKEDISNKLNDITTIMKSYQNELWDTLYIEMKYK